MAVKLDRETGLKAGDRGTASARAHARIRPHYLVQLKTISLFTEMGTTLHSVPDWVSTSLCETPFVVVRRAAFDATRSQRDDMIAVGVRGYSREQRFGAFISTDTINRVISPADIVLSFTDSLPRAKGTTSGALLALESLKNLWHCHDLAWGPGGSVGFELVTKRPSITDSSDLDIVIYADEPIPVSDLRNYLDDLSALNINVDAQIETPSSAFSLAEYVREHPKSILLKTPAGPMLGAAPWNIDRLSTISELEP